MACSGPGSWGASPALYPGPRRRCWLQWENPNSASRKGYRNLKHSDWKLGREQARKLALELAAMLGAEARGILTVGDLFARYEAAKTPEKSPAQQQEDKRRIAMWMDVLGATRNVETIDPATIDEFKRRRAAGEIVFTKVIEGKDGRREVMRLKKKPTLRTIGMDIAFLHAVLHWAELQRDSAGRPLLDRNPTRGYTRPDTATPGGRSPPTTGS